MRTGQWLADYDKIYTVLEKTLQSMDCVSFDKECRKMLKSRNLKYESNYSWYIQHYIWTIAAGKLDMEYQRFPLAPISLKIC